MADPFKILSAGDAVKAGDGPFNTQWHNAVSDATKAALRDSVPSTAPIRPIEIPRDGEIWIANVSEANVDQFTAIGLGQLAIPPDDAGDFRERLCFLSAPLAAGQPFGIVQDPIGPGELYVCKTASGPGGQPPRSGWIRVKGDAAAWSSATTYAIGQQVTHDGETWIAKAASTNQAPASGSYWQISGAHRGIWDRDETYTPSDVVLLPQLGRIHIAGVSRAYLDIRNTEHAYAGIESGELVSQRAPGPLAILWRGGIGSNWAVVRFCCDETLTTPDVTGTGALDLGAIVPAATCTYLYTPGGAPEFGAVAVAGTGTYTPPAFTGSGALALGAAESAGVSLSYDVPPSGRLNLGVLTADGDGEVTTPPRGRCRLRLGSLEAAGTGAVTFPAFTGSGALDLGAVFVEHAHAHINRVVSINGSTVEKQVLSVGTAGADFAIDDSTPGTHVLNLPDASANAWALDTTPGGSQDVSGADSRGAVNVGDQIFYGNKGCTEDHYAAKYVGESLTSSRNWTAGFDQSNPWSPGHAAVTVLNSKSGSVWAAAAGLSSIGSVDVDGTTSCVDVTFMVNVAGDEAEYVYDAGFTGTIVGLSSPTLSAKTWSPRYKYLSGFTALNNPTYENGFTGSALGKTWIGGHMVGAAGPVVTQAEGGTGIDTSGVTDGQLLVGKTSDHSWNLATLTAGSGITITPGAGTITIAASGGGSLSDGDYGDITVGSSGTTMTIDAGAVTYAKLQDVSATSRVLGRKSSGAGDAEECTLSEILDFIGSAAQGDLLYRGASAWARLAAPSSAAGQQLRSGGTGTNPGWVDGHGPAMVQNLNLYASASAGALTIELLTNNGTTPSATDYCVIPFRSVSTSTGFAKYRQITGAKTLVIPSGATLGATSGVPFRVWIGAVDSLVDAIPETGTIQLFAINCYDGASTIYPLRDNQTANPTAIGTGSDSAGAMYSPATVSGGARAIRILGYFEWPSGLTTAGTWTFASTDIAQLYHAGVPLPGDRIQVAVAADSAGASGTTAIPADDTIPQNTEGDQIQTVSITPRSAANMLRVTAYAFLSTNTNNNTVGYCLFRDSIADTKLASWYYISGVFPSQHGALLYPGEIAGSTSSTTYKTRMGGYTGTCYFNKHGDGNRYYGGAWHSYLTVEEVMA